MPLTEIKERRVTKKKIINKIKKINIDVMCDIKEMVYLSTLKMIRKKERDCSCTKKDEWSFYDNHHSKWQK